MNRLEFQLWMDYVCQISVAAILKQIYFVEIVIVDNIHGFQVDYARVPVKMLQQLDLSQAPLCDKFLVKDPKALFNGHDYRTMQL